MFILHKDSGRTSQRTLCLYYKDQSVEAVQGCNGCLL